MTFVRIQHNRTTRFLFERFHTPQIVHRVDQGRVSNHKEEMKEVRTSESTCVEVRQWSPTNNGILVAGLKSISGTSHAGVLFGSRANLASRNSENRIHLYNYSRHVFNYNINGSVTQADAALTRHPIVSRLRRIHLESVQLSVDRELQTAGVHPRHLIAFPLHLALYRIQQRSSIVHV